MSPSAPQDSSRLQDVAAQLASLGAETAAQRQAKSVLPWVFSIAAHACVFTVAAFLTWSVANLPAKEESVLIVADFNAMQYEPVISLREHEALQDQVAPPTMLDLAPPVPEAQDILSQLDQSPRDPLAALAASEFAGDSARALAQFAQPSSANMAQLFGLTGSNARRIVYAIDATGSMIAHLQIVIDELERSLSNLSPQQQFAIVFFQGREAIEVPPGRLVPARPQERERALKWIRENVIPRGGTDPLVAIQKAMKHKPDVVFLLSHDITGYGQFEVDQRELLAMLDRLNPVDPVTGRRVTQINCIQFLDEDPLDTMRAIASEHGGRNGYKFLSRRDLGLGQ